MIRSSDDAFGWEIFDWYRGVKSFEIIEREDGYIDVSSGSLIYFLEYENWPDHQKTGLRHAKGKILDIGCGAGRIALWLQEKGYDVIGIDNSPLALKVCRLRGVRKVKLMPIENIGKFKKNSFDTIVMMGNNFGLFGSFKKAKKLLRIMHKITSENALIIAEANDPYETKEKEFLSYHAFNRRRGRMSGQTRIRVRYKDHTSPWFDYLLVSEKEMREILKNTGWEINDLIKSGKSSYVAVIGKAVK